MNLMLSMVWLFDYWNCSLIKAKEFLFLYILKKSVTSGLVVKALDS